MGVEIEFYGIPRERAGVARVEMPVDEETIRLGDVVLWLAQRYPQLARDCFDGRRLKPTYVANVNGDRFVGDPETPLGPGQTLLILSADAGG